MTCIYLKYTTQVEIFWLSSQPHHSGHFGWLWKRECDCLEQQGRPPIVDFKHNRFPRPDIPNRAADYDWQKVTFFHAQIFDYIQLLSVTFIWHGSIIYTEIHFASSVQCVVVDGAVVMAFILSVLFFLLLFFVCLFGLLLVPLTNLFARWIINEDFWG